MKILVVDDEPIAVQGVVDSVDFKKLGFCAVYTAECYTEAVEVLLREKIDLAICDIEMPDESGIELIEWMRKHSPQTESIILSGHDEFDYARQAVRLDCLEYVLKPVRYEVLTEVVERAVRKIQNRRKTQIMTEYGQKYIENLQKSETEEGDGVEKVARYVDEHLDSDLSVSALAGMVFLSKDHLTRSFKKRYGKTVSEYILEKRMQLARELLWDSRLTVTMVAGKVGFGSYSHFTEQFKKYYGMPPRDFQKIRRDKP